MQRQLGETLLLTVRNLVRRYGPRLGIATAQDLASEAMLRALQNPPPDGRFSPWMERIFKNLMIDSWRMRRVRSSVESLPIATMAPSAEEEVLTKESLRKLRLSLAELPPALNQAVVLRCLEEQEESVVSAALGVAPPTIRTRVHRALGRMRSTLRALHSFFPLGQNFQQIVCASFSPVIPVLLASTFYVGMTHSMKTDDILSPSPLRKPGTPHLMVKHPSISANPPSEMPPLALARPLLSRSILAQAHAEKSKAPSAVLYDFENDEVVGELKQPDGVNIVGPPTKANQSSLIEIPENFIPAFQKMTENLL